MLQSNKENPAVNFEGLSPQIRDTFDTLIVYISGDNGASAEVTINGTPNEFTTFNGVPVLVKDQVPVVRPLGVLSGPSRTSRRLGPGR